MITVVIDTNVFVSALIGGGNPLVVIEAARLRQVNLLISAAILAEMQTTLGRAKFSHHFQRRKTEPSLFISSYTEVAQSIVPSPITDCPISDPKDLKFIECAVAGKADYIVSGDHHLLELKSFRDVRMVMPTQFISILSQQAKSTPDDPTTE